MTHANAARQRGNMNASTQGRALNFTEAMRWYRLAADQGFAEAQIIIGNMYASAQGVPRDFTEAMRWYRLAADQGLPKPRSLLEICT
jgi:TPR repeat protein